MNRPHVTESIRWNDHRYPFPPQRTVDARDITHVDCQAAIAKMEVFQERLRVLQVGIDVLELSKSRQVSRHSLAEVALSVLRVLGRDIHASITTLQLSQEYAESIGAFASALPLTRSVRSLRCSFLIRCDMSPFVVDTSTNVNANEVNQQPLVWLGYALFHPDTRSSTWRSLRLHDANLTHFPRILKAMARGNNLAALLEGREPTSDAYYQATMAADASVFDRPSTGAAALKLLASDGSLAVEVCDVNTEDPTEWTEWVAVVVPGHGLGYVRSRDVTSVHTRNASAVVLTELIFKGWKSWPNLPAMLQLIGWELVRLECDDASSFDSHGAASELLRHCPSLETLSVASDGTPWSDPELHRLLPRLRELQLEIGYKFRHPRQTLSSTIWIPESLRVLRVNAVGTHTKYTWNAASVPYILAQKSNLRVFHWQRARRRWSHPLVYTRTIDESARRIQDLKLPLIERSLVGRPDVSSSHALAFLSVMTSSSWEPMLSEELVKHILRFACGHCAAVWTW